MDELDVKITLKWYSEEVLEAKSTEELREIVTKLKKELDLRKIFFGGHCGVCKWRVIEESEVYAIPFKQIKCLKHDKIVKDSLICYDFEVKKANQINI